MITEEMVQRVAVQVDADRYMYQPYEWVGYDASKFIVVDAYRCPYCGSAQHNTPNAWPPLPRILRWEWTDYECGTSAAVGTGWIPGRLSDFVLLAITRPAGVCAVRTMAFDDRDDTI